MKPTTPFKIPARSGMPLPRQQPDKPDLYRRESGSCKYPRNGSTAAARASSSWLINDPSHLQDSPTDAGGNIEQEYKDAVEAAVADKETQAENLENRLESLIDKKQGGSFCSR